jgi:cysteinyl-tRNA synthetase
VAEGMMILTDGMWGNFVQNAQEAVQNSHDEMAKLIQSETEYKARRDQALFDAADNTEKIQEKVSEIRSALEAEQIEREKADKKNHNDAVKWHKIDLAIAIIGVIVGIVGVVIAIFH